MLLTGIRILDLTRLLPGPYATRLLCDLGAEVIKVEDPGAGDYLRAVPPAAGGTGAWFQCLNHGKRCVRLNLKDPRGREAFLRLTRTAHAVIEGFRPGVMERLGLGFADLRRVNPRLVLVSLTGYGQAGPCRDRAGHDLNYLARSGLLALMPPGPDGAPLLPPVQMADLCAGGLIAALGLLAALWRAQAAGEGLHVDAAMLDGLLSLGGPLLAEAAVRGETRREDLRLAGALACYRTYPTADGRAVALAALEPKFWAAFCQAAGREDWLSRQWDPDQAALAAEIAGYFRQHPLAHWAAWAAAHPDACVEPVLTPAEAARHPAVAARGILGRLPGAPAAHPPGLALSPLMVRTGDGPWLRPGPAAPTGPAAPAGMHTREILTSVGYTPAELDALASAGVI